MSTEAAPVTANPRRTNLAGAGSETTSGEAREYGTDLPPRTANPRRTQV